MIGSVDKGLDAEYIRKIIKIEKTQNTRCLQCKEYKENKCRICSCLFGNYENTGNCYIPSEINCELTRHVNNIFREKYSEEQVAMLRKHYRESCSMGYKYRVVEIGEYVLIIQREKIFVLK